VALERSGIQQLVVAVVDGGGAQAIVAEKAKGALDFIDLREVEAEVPDVMRELIGRVLPGVPHLPPIEPASHTVTPSMDATRYAEATPSS
jgi:hypothetical protein